MTDKVDIWMPLYVKDYLGATSRLTTEQHGAYMLIIMDYWLNGPPPDDDAVLSHIARLPIEKWQGGIKQALNRHFTVEGGAWNKPRIDKEIESATARKRRGVKGAEGKWGERDAQNQKTRSQRLAEARKKATHTSDEWEALKAFQGACARCGADGDLVKDHIKPIYQGGSDGIENLQPLCKSCNSSKGPESTDFRKDGWQNACKTPAKSLLNDCPAPSPAPTSSQPKEKVKTTVSDKPDHSSSIARVFSHWQTKCDHPRAKLDDRRKKAIRNRLKDGYAEDDLLRAVDGCAVSPWHQGDNPDGRMYDDIELICRDGKHVDQFIKIADDPSSGSGLSASGRKTAQAARDFINEG